MLVFQQALGSFVTGFDHTLEEKIFSLCLLKRWGRGGETLHTVMGPCFLRN